MAFEHTQQQRIAIRALGEVLQARLHEALREDLGGTYGVTVGATYAQIPVPEYSVSINFSCAPERTNELLKAAMTQVETLKAKGPTEKEISDTREKMLRDLETNSKQNGYWVTQLLLRYQTGESLDTLFAMPEQYKKLTPQMIHEAAQRYLNPANRVTVTPDMRCSASATDLSGKAPMSVAVIESITVSASFLISCDVCSALRMPVTRISVISSSDFVVVALVLSAGAAASWAIANGASSVAPATRMDNSVARD